MIPGGGKPLRLLYLTQAEEFGYFLERGGSRALVESNNLIEKKSGNWEFWAGLPSEITPLCRPITTCQREAKAIPLISGTDRAEISATDRADCGGTRFSGPPIWRMLQPAPRSVSYPSEGPSIRE
jgi:hypothetical protein